MSGKRPNRPATLATLPAAAFAVLMLIAASCTSNPISLSPPAASDATTPASPAAQSPTTAGPAATAPPVTSVIATSAPCRARLEYGYVLPDRSCTPGVTNPEVTQANIAQTICAGGWTTTVRPPQSYTEPLKRSQMAEYGDTRPIYDYEEDHLIPLGLGGAPSDPHNLWPQLGASPNPKDEVESAANHAVCDGRMTLASAQRQIASDWVSLGRALGVITGPGSQSPQP
jgi:hypothetical protein